MRILYTLMLALGYMPLLMAQQITQIEYFFDNDLGHGKNKLVNVTLPGLEVSLDFIPIPLQNVSPGHHALYVRAKDTTGQWGITQRQVIYVNPSRKTPANIVRLDYYYVNGNTITASYSRQVSGNPDLDEPIQANATALQHGQSYTLYTYATNENGVRSQVSTLNFTYTQVLPISLTVAKQDVSCNGHKNGSITITASGGTGTLQYSLDNKTFGTSNQYQNLAAGEYTVYVRGSGQATYVESRKITITEPSALAVQASVQTQPNCATDSTGSIILAVSGGIPPYQYKPGSGPYQSGSIFSKLPTGTHAFTVKDKNNCEKSVSVVLDPSGDSPPKPTVKILQGITGISTELILECSITADAYQWYNKGLAISGAVAKTYQVASSDFTGSNASFSVRVTNSVSGCNNISDAFSITGIREQIIESSLKIYPNPVQETLMIELEPSVSSKAESINLYTSQGILLSRQMVQHDLQFTRIQVAHLPSGLYILQIQGKDFVLHRSVQKTK